MKASEELDISLQTEILSFIRSLIPTYSKDLFSRTQGRLTLIYSGLLILFLTLFIVIVYTVLYFTILKSSERELQTLVSQEVSFIENYLVENQQKDLRGVQTQEIVFAGVNQSFYYVMNSSGEILMGNEDDSRLRPALITLLTKKMGKGNELFSETLHINGTTRGKGKPGEFHHSEPEQDITLMIASESIYYNGQFIGQLYIGKDISFAYQLFNWVLLILIVLGILFFGVAIFISHKMSKKAMIPITRAFTRQREFVADASHELRTPLAVMLSSIDAMDMTIEPEKDEFSGRLLSNMRQEVKRLTNLVSDLLTLARSDSISLELRTETFDFKALAEHALASLRPLAQEKHLSTNFYAPASLVIAGDPDRLAQLLYILLDNAIKYTPNGGEVNLFLSKEGSTLCMDVRDTGIGIPKEDLERIFERFYRQDKSRSRQIVGHGLGLSIAKWIVDTHKGSIKVTSEFGEGSTFSVRIPEGSKIRF